jgi:hypothetical protein
VASSVFLGTLSFTQQYAPLAAREGLPGLGLASWLATWTNLPGIAITITFVFLLFPDGHLPSPRWRPVAWVTAVATVVPTVALAARAWPLRGPDLVAQSFDHPALGAAFDIGFPVVLACRWSPWPRWSSGSAAPGGGAPADQVVRLRAMIGIPLACRPRSRSGGRSWSWSSHR